MKNKPPAREAEVSTPGMSAYASPPGSPGRRHRRRGGAPALPLSPPAAAAAATAATTDAADPPTARYATLDAAVKIFAVHAEPHYSLPWSIRRQYPSSSSAFVIPGRRLITNAHCVQDAIQVRVKRRDGAERYLAEVVAVSTEADLAILSVPDARFWDGEGEGGSIPAVTFADEVPRLQDRVMVAGYSVGGVGLSITAGVVSRIEVQGYAHSGAELLAIQSDAPISSGNSGGPAFQADGKCIGVAFQSLRGDEAEGIGYVIPLPIVRRFLDDVDRNGRYTGFAALGVEWQKLESAALRRALGVDEGSSVGVMVRRVEPTAPAASVLRRGDILLAFDGTQIASDGTVPFRQGERIAFSYLVSQKFVGETVDLLVLRAPKGAFGDEDSDGEDSDSWGAGDDEEEGALGAAGGEDGQRGGASAVARVATATAAAHQGGRSRGRSGGGGGRGASGASTAAAPLPWPKRNPEIVRVRLDRPVRLVPWYQDPGRRPSYFVFGGLLFTPLSAPYLRSEFGKEFEAEGPVSLVARLTNGIARTRDEQVVLLAQVLAHKVNVGFEDIVAAPVRSVNGRRVRSMRALVAEVEAVLARNERFLRIELAHRTEVLLDARAAAEATPEILSAHAIAQDRSADLLEEEEDKKSTGAAAAAGANKKQKTTKRARR